MRYVWAREAVLLGPMRPNCAEDMSKPWPRDKRHRSRSSLRADFLDLLQFQLFLLGYGNAHRHWSAHRCRPASLTVALSARCPWHWQPP